MRVSDVIRVHPRAAFVTLGVGLMILVLLAAASAVLQFVRTGSLTRALREHRSDSLPPRVEWLTATLGVSGLVDIVESPEAFAFCHGLWHPRLMLSSALIEAMPDDELEAVLRHEAAHLRRRDPLRILIARSLAFALRLIPSTHAMLEAYLCRRELEADDESVSLMGDVAPLASALHRMLTARQAGDFSSLAVGALSATDLRIDRLLGNGPPPRAPLTNVNKAHVFAFALFVTVALCVLISTAHAATGVRPCVPC